MLRFVYFPIAVSLCYPLANAEAATNKCTDGKRVTYANIPCEDLGLKSVGPVKSVVTVIPAAPTAAESGKENNAREYKATQDETAGDKTPGGTAIKPVNPLVEKMLDW